MRQRVDFSGRCSPGALYLLLDEPFGALGTQNPCDMQECWRRRSRQSPHCAPGEQRSGAAWYWPNEWQFYPPAGPGGAEIEVNLPTARARTPAELVALRSAPWSAPRLRRYAINALLLGFVGLWQLGCLACREWHDLHARLAGRDWQRSPRPRALSTTPRHDSKRWRWDGDLGGGREVLRGGLQLFGRSRGGLSAC